MCACVWRAMPGCFCVCRRASAVPCGGPDGKTITLCASEAMSAHFEPNQNSTGLRCHRRCLSVCLCICVSVCRPCRCRWRCLCACVALAASAQRRRSSLRPTTPLLWVRGRINSPRCAIPVPPLRGCRVDVILTCLAPVYIPLVTDHARKFKREPPCCSACHHRHHSFFRSPATPHNTLGMVGCLVPRMSLSCCARAPLPPSSLLPIAGARDCVLCLCVCVSAAAAAARA